MRPAAVQAEVTDEQIESCALEAGFSVESTGSIWAVDGYDGTRVDPGLRKFAKAILALRPERVPMTDEQADALATEAFGEYMCDLSDDIELALVRKVEAYHGITAQAKKEGA